MSTPPGKSPDSDFDAHAQQWGAAISRNHSVAADGPLDVESLRVCVVSSPLNERLEAVRLLPSFGTTALEPLCTALADRDVGVRTAAAAGLAEVGDARAIRPLAEALKNCFVSRSGCWSLLASFSAAAAGTLLLIGAVVTLDVLALTMLFSGGSFSDLLTERKRRSELVEAITNALIRIAERDPNPELRQVLPDLHLVGMDVIQQLGRTRSASRSAANRIGQLTVRLHNLPIASAAATIDAETLPLPSERK
jgi:HEAT repeat protein